MSKKFPLTYSKDDINFIFSMCTMSPYVNNNSEYKKKASETRIVLSDASLVNAFASGSNSSYKIQLNAGLCDICAFIGLALAKYRVDRNIYDLSTACKWAGDASIANEFKFTKQLVLDGIEKFKYTESDTLFHDAGSYFTGLVLSVCGHELGHICCGHTLNQSVSNQTSRNDERTADLFAQSIISATPFGSYLILSSLFVEIVFAWMSPNEEESPATTHPYSRERVYNILTSHEEYLNSLGINKSNIDNFLP